jgi:hypothetical protein
LVKKCYVGSRFKKGGVLIYGGNLPPPNTPPNGLFWDAWGCIRNFSRKFGKELREILGHLNKKVKPLNIRGLRSELAGTRTQDPYIKSVLLYQLSYQFKNFFFNRLARWESNLAPMHMAGTRTQDPYIKSVLLYQLSYQFISFLRGGWAPCFWECKNRVKRNGGKKLRDYFSTGN